jgi:hypothetical protein
MFYHIHPGEAIFNDIHVGKKNLKSELIDRSAFRLMDCPVSGGAYELLH